MPFTEIQISGLREGVHSFRFDLDSRFSEAFSQDFFSDPRLVVTIELRVSETLIQADLAVSGDVELECDRSLDVFRHPVNEKITHFFKFGEEEMELSDELEVIHPERVSLDLDQLIYDTVALALPGKKLHPRFVSQESSEDDELIYSTQQEIEANENERDTRWDILKNLN
jgi:uncharacterized metal-binding protein YceD (DUF177 family)